MYRPFDYINGKKIDVNNPEHQSIIIKRNKNLEAIVSNEFQLDELTNEVDLSFKTDCPKCGTKIHYETTIDIDWRLIQNIADHVEDINCTSCNFKYVKKSHLSNLWKGKISDVKSKIYKQLK